MAIQDETDSECSATAREEWFWVSCRAQENHPLNQKQSQNPKQKRKDTLVKWQSEPTNPADIQNQHLLSTAYELPDDCLQTCLSPVTKLAHLASLMHLHMYIFFCCFSLTMDIELQSQSQSPRQYGDMLLWKSKKSGTFVGPHSQS